LSLTMTSTESFGPLRRNNASQGAKPGLRIVCGELDDGTRVVEPHGEIDIATAWELRTALDEALADESRSVIVDLGEVRFIGACGLRVLLAFEKQLARSGRSLITVCGDPMRRKVFEITSTAKQLQVVASRADAVALAQGSGSVG
jgi:anti-sigma B factor antagonist